LEQFYDTCARTEPMTPSLVLCRYVTTRYGWPGETAEQGDRYPVEEKKEYK
jgi:hypothetical protein